MQAHGNQAQGKQGRDRRIVEVGSNGKTKSHTAVDVHKPSVAPTVARINLRSMPMDSRNPAYWMMGELEKQGIKFHKYNRFDLHVSSNDVQDQMVAPWESMQDRMTGDIIVRQWTSHHSPMGE